MGYEGCDGYFVGYERGKHTVNRRHHIRNSLSRHKKPGVNHLWAYHCSAGTFSDDTINFKISIGCALRKSNFKSL
jgi:hypothetical protein